MLGGASTSAWSLTADLAPDRGAAILGTALSRAWKSAAIDCFRLTFACRFRAF